MEKITCKDCNEDFVREVEGQLCPYCIDNRAIKKTNDYVKAVEAKNKQLQSRVKVLEDALNEAATDIYIVCDDGNLEYSKELQDKYRAIANGEDDE